MGAVRSGLGCLSWVLAFVIIIAILLKVVLFDVAVFGHNGMAPTLLRGERVLINKRSKPEVGTIAVCKHPSEEGWVVGRVAARDGMWIESFGDTLRIDGTAVDFEEHGVTKFHNVDNDVTSTVHWGIEEFGDKPHQIFMGEPSRHLVRKTQAEPGKIYLLGDYRAYMGQDSRSYGLVDESTCRGTIVFRLFPVEGLGPELAHGYFEAL